jgi:hypothetical protein
MLSFEANDGSNNTDGNPLVCSYWALAKPEIRSMNTRRKVGFI